MSRALAGLLSILLTLLLLVFGLAGLLLLTTAGAKWLADWAMELEPRLTLVIDSGAIARGLVVADLSWRDDAIEVAATRAELEWSPDCLLAARVCIDRLALAGLRVAVRSVVDEAEPESTATADIRLPLPVHLQLLQVNDVRLTAPNTEIALRSLQASGSFSGNVFTLEWLRAAGLDVAVAESAEATPTDTVATTASQPIQLPEIDLPLDLIIQNLLLEDSSVRLADNDFAVHQLTISAALRDSELKIERIELKAEPLAAELAGRIALTGAYPLSAQLRMTMTSPDLPAPLQLSSKLDGSLQQLGVSADLTGPLPFHAEATLQPLLPSLPFEIAARWQRLAYPLMTKAVVELRDGELQVKGDMAAYEGALLTAIVGEQLPEGDWHIQFSGDTEQLRVSRLEAALLAGRLSAEGLLGWGDGLYWQARLQAQGLNPGIQWPDYPGTLGGELEVSGQAGEGGLSFSATTPGINGSLRGYPLALQGAVSKSADDLWRFDRLRLLSGRNQLDIDGRLEQDWALQGRFDLPDPNALLPELAGSVSGRFTVEGAMLEPDITLRMQGDKLRYQDNALEAIELQLDARRLALEHSSLRWTAGGLRLGEQQLDRIEGALSGSRAEHELALSAASADYSGQLRLHGGLDSRFNWAGELLSATLGLPPRQQWTLSEPAGLSWQQASRELSVAAHCWRQRGASLCLRENTTLGEAGDVQLALSDFRLNWLAPWLPQGLRWRGPLDGQASVRWQPDMPPTARVGLASSSGTVVLDQEEADPLTLTYDRIGAQLTLEQNALDVSLELASRDLGGGRLTLHTRLDSESHPLDGDIALEGLQLGLLQAFLPEVQTLAGAVGVNGRLAGTAQEPQFIGAVRLANGEFTAANLPMALTDIQFRADVTGNDAQLDGSFRSGDGKASISGSASWGGEAWLLDFAVNGDRLRFFYEQVADLQVSPNLNIRVEPQQVRVEGRVLVPRGRITLQELPEGAVAVSNDVVVINRPGAAEEEQIPAADWSVTIDIELALGDAVRIEGYGLEGRLAGNLRLRQRPQGVPEGLGELRVVDGRYEAYGQKLEIRQGQLLFSGPLQEPNLNVEAVRRVDNVVAGLRIEGEPDQPQVSLFSEPGLPQEEILSYLIRGRPLDAEGAGSDQLLAQAALSLGIFGGRGFASSLASELGVEEFEVGTAGEGEETQVELSGYIAPDLLVRYGIGVFEPVNTLTLRYRINKNFFVEAVSGLESALDFFYEFEF